jgi:hypothetical protein
MICVGDGWTSRLWGVYTKEHHARQQPTRHGCDVVYCRGKLLGFGLSIFGGSIIFWKIDLTDMNQHLALPQVPVQPWCSRP